MKIKERHNLSHIIILLMTLAFLQVQIRGQTIQTLVSFNGTNGAYPVASLTLAGDGNFYGTADNGGPNNLGTIFRLTTNGIMSILVEFNGTNGTDPAAKLTLGNDTNFYGTTYEGGTGIGGTVFMMMPGGTLTSLFSFTDTFQGIWATNGLFPTAPLTLGNDGAFYGTTTRGGDTNLDGGAGFGTIFRITTNGILTRLISFNATNGASPSGGLTLGRDGNFYGMTHDGGAGITNGNVTYGTIFKLATNGVLTTLFSFDSTNGAAPVGTLTESADGLFYGTTTSGGTNGGGGTIFRITTDGILTSLHSFQGGTDGDSPLAGLTTGPDGSFYGVTISGGTTNDVFTSGMGTIFKLSTNGTFSTLTSFLGFNGAMPVAALTLGNDGFLYGTTQAGGNTNLNGGSGYGTIFRLSLTPIIQPTLRLEFLSGYPFLSLYGNLGGTYTIEYSSNLMLPGWTPLLIVPNLSTNPFQMIDPSGFSQRARFYRAIQMQ